MYISMNIEIETFSFHFFFVRVWSKYFLFYCVLWNVHLFISPTFFNHQGEIFFFSRIHVTLAYYTQLHVLSLPNIVYCFLKLFLLFHYRNFPNMHTITSLVSLQLHLGIHKQQRSCLNIQQASNRGDFLNERTVYPYKYGVTCQNNALSSLWNEG